MFRCYVSVVHIPTTEGMVLIAALASLELYDDVQVQRSLPSPCLVFHLRADSLCFWSCLYLQLAASKRQQFFWYHRARNPQGVALDPKHCEEELSTARNWALQQGNGTMPSDTKKRIEAGIIAHRDDIEACFSQCFQSRLRSLFASFALT